MCLRARRRKSEREGSDVDGIVGWERLSPRPADWLVSPHGTGPPRTSQCRARRRSKATRPVPRAMQPMVADETANPSRRLWPPSFLMRALLSWNRGRLSALSSSILHLFLISHNLLLLAGERPDPYPVEAKDYFLARPGRRWTRHLPPCRPRKAGLYSVGLARIPPGFSADVAFGSAARAGPMRRPRATVEQRFPSHWKVGPRALPEGLRSL